METFNPGPRPSSRTQLADWYTAVLNEQERSGLSVEKFAKVVGVCVPTLYSWKRRLTAPSSTDFETTPGLVEIQVRDTCSDVQEPHLPIILRLGRKLSLEVPTNFNAAELTRLVQTLEGC